MNKRPQSQKRMFKRNKKKERKLYIMEIRGQKQVRCARKIERSWTRTPTHAPPDAKPDAAPTHAATARGWSNVGEQAPKQKRKKIPRKGQDKNESHRGTGAIGGVVGAGAAPKTKHWSLRRRTQRQRELRRQGEANRDASPKT
ncbi:hypothetical protein C8J57DRAFT_1236619 [Mycena rebaudengoi]|nr:hypothetical protein C8J57DRAFT_1236619 [Mycena rebaudengoi]